MRKNGRTTSECQRWRCGGCGTSQVRVREERARMAEFRAFLAWATGKESMEEAAARLGVTGRSFARCIAWCRNVRPAIPADGVVHDCIEADGTYTGHGWCLLVATDGNGRPVAWQWCDAEKKASYRALFRRIARPGALVCDGGAGCIAAAREEWSGIRVQRYLVHVLCNAGRDLTNRPNTDTGRELLALARALTGVDDGEKASEWLSVIGGILALTVTDRRARDLSGNAISVPCSSRVYARNGERDRRH